MLPHYTDRTLTACDLVRVLGALEVKDFRAHDTGVDERNRDLEGSELQSKRRPHGFHSMLCSRVHLGGKRHLWSRCARSALARACSGGPLQPCAALTAAVSETLPSRVGCSNFSHTEAPRSRVWCTGQRRSRFARCAPLGG
eukprot:scaffold2122_cov69-Phaeocystis_antarctica.AAC.7